MFSVSFASLQVKPVLIRNTLMKQDEQFDRIYAETRDGLLRYLLIRTERPFSHPVYSVCSTFQLDK